MKFMEPSDLSALQAAQEFMKNGELDPAEDQLNRISAEAHDHPEVLEIRWEILAQRQQWPQALEISQKLCQAAPENQYGWMYQSTSLAELNRVREAYELLGTVVERFPKEPSIPYNLACCACKLKRLQEAGDWIVRAAAIGGRAEIKLMALQDPDLAPILDRICAF